MKTVLVFLLLGLTPAYLSAQSAEEQAYLALVRDLVGLLAPDCSSGTRSPDCPPLLVDVESFAYLGRFAAREPVEQSAISAAIGRPFVNMRESTAVQCQKPCGTWRDGTFVQLNGAMRVAGRLQILVTVMSTHPHHQRGKTIDIHWLRFSYIKERDRWVQVERETLGVT